MSEIEKTIEELEAEVLSELEEAENPTKKEALPAEKTVKVQAEKVKVKAKEDHEDEDEDEDEDEVKAGYKAEKKKLAAGDEVEHEGEDLEEGKSPRTKADHIEYFSNMKVTEMKGMLKAYQSSLAEEEDEEEDEEDVEELKKLEAAKKEIEEKIKAMNVKEDVEALCDGEDLSEEFKEKAATIFEAAVKSKTREEIGQIIAITQEEKEKEIETFKEELSDKVDSYLDYVVDEWTKENELAIERGLKGEIAEDFISGLKQLFEDHYIDVPDEKYDVLEAQSEKISELEGKLNEMMEKNIEIKESNQSLVREQVISEVSEDLADTEVEKFKSLVDDVEYTDTDSFRTKLDTLKENYFPKTTSDSRMSHEEDGSTAQDIDTTDTMKKYLSAISRGKQASA